MIDLYYLLVETVFGGFWIATIAMAFIYTIILKFGDVSEYSIGQFLLIFFLTMGLGSGMGIITIPIVIFILSWSILQMRRYYEEV